MWAELRPSPQTGQQILASELSMTVCVKQHTLDADNLWRAAPGAGTKTYL